MTTPNTARFQFLLPPELHELIRIAAAARGWSMQEYIRNAIRTTIERDAAQPSGGVVRAALARAKEDQNAQ